MPGSKAFSAAQQSANCLCFNGFCFVCIWNRFFGLRASAVASVSKGFGSASTSLNPCLPPAPRSRHMFRSFNKSFPRYFHLLKMSERKTNAENLILPDTCSRRSPQHIEAFQQWHPDRNNSATHCEAPDRGQTERAESEKSQKANMKGTK